ncbi:hypothetical protein PIB30_016381 [Stylosanthes scabra]|uniref:Uncharacterized protein n=1 Tax=Stylosanthes scabra TaxID=79078 RepID=A0ABU6T730_9FABA|nr:hypothetical protein [Stylosanthes scabra]
MVEDEIFLAQVHHDSMINYKSRKRVKFTDKNPTNVFITTRTRLVDLHHSILRRLGVDGKGRLSMIYYRILISIVAQAVNYGCFAIEGDEDLQELFDCRRQFPEVRTMDLFVEIVKPLVSSGSSTSNPHSTNIAESSHPMIQHDTEEHQVASPSFGFNIALVEEALRPNDSDDEPVFIEGDSDDDLNPVPMQQGGASSSGTQQYPPHLSNLNLEALSGPSTYRAFCTRHVATNFALKFKSVDAKKLLMNAAYAKNKVDFNYWHGLLEAENPVMSV